MQYPADCNRVVLGHGLQCRQQTLAFSFLSFEVDGDIKGIRGLNPHPSPYKTAAYVSIKPTGTQLLIFLLTSQLSIQSHLFSYITFPCNLITIINIFMFKTSTSKVTTTLCVPKAISERHGSSLVAFPAKLQASRAILPPSSYEFEICMQHSCPKIMIIQCTIFVIKLANQPPPWCQESKDTFSWRG